MGPRCSPCPSSWTGGKSLGSSHQGLLASRWVLLGSHLLENMFWGALESPQSLIRFSLCKLF